MQNRDSSYVLGVEFIVAARPINRHDSRYLTRAYFLTARLRRLGVSLAAIGLLGGAFPQLLHAQAPNLGTAANFAVLAGSTVTNTGTTVLLGSLGVSPGSAITGFPPGIVLAPSTVHIGDAVAVQAQIDLANGYNAAASRPTTTDLTGQNLSGLTLTPGVYNFANAAQLTGALTLNALGNPTAVFIFNIGTTLTTGSASSVTVIGGGLGSNVYWRVGSSATLGSTTAFMGDILALTSITLDTDANITCGSALARNGAVTLDTNNVATRNLSTCAMAALLNPSTPPGATPPGTGGGAGFTPPPGSVEAAIDAAFANAVANNTLGAFPQGFLNLAALSPALQSLALQELSGELSTGAAPSGILAMNSFLSLVLNPFAGNQISDNRSEFGPAPPALVVKALGYGPDSPAATNVPAYGAIDRAIAISGFDPRRLSVWSAGYGGQAQSNGNANLGTHDLTARDYGFVTGVDYRIFPKTIVGFALGGGGTNFGLSDGFGSGRSDMFQAAVYSSTRMGAAYVSAALAYSWFDVTTSQYLTVPAGSVLTAKFAANDVGARIEGGYRFVVPDIHGITAIGITPYAAIQAQAFQTPTYSENPSSDFARRFNATTTTAVRTELGAWVDQAHQIEAGTILILRGRAAWEHDNISDPTIEAGFLSLPESQFTVTGVTMPKDLLLTTVGSEIRWLNGFSVAVQFDAAFANHAERYSGTSTIRYRW